jgi:hypothetical protein
MSNRLSQHKDSCRRPRAWLTASGGNKPSVLQCVVTNEHLVLGLHTAPRQTRSICISVVCKCHHQKRHCLQSRHETNLRCAVESWRQSLIHAVRLGSPVLCLASIIRLRPSREWMWFEDQILRKDISGRCKVLLTKTRARVNHRHASTRCLTMSLHTHCVAKCATGSIYSKWQACTSYRQTAPQEIGILDFWNKPRPGPAPYAKMSLYEKSILFCTSM